MLKRHFDGHRLRKAGAALQQGVEHIGRSVVQGAAAGVADVTRGEERGWRARRATQGMLAELEEQIGDGNGPLANAIGALAARGARDGARAVSTSAGALAALFVLGFFVGLVAGRIGKMH
jgi:hypothetical protein